MSGYRDDKTRIGMAKVILELGIGKKYKRWSGRMMWGMVNGDVFSMQWIRSERE